MHRQAPFQALALAKFIMGRRNFDNSYVQNLCTYSTKTAIRLLCSELKGVHDVRDAAIVASAHKNRARIGVRK